MDQRVPTPHDDMQSKPKRRSPRRTKHWKVDRIPGGWRTLAIVGVALIIGVVAWVIHPLGSTGRRPPQDAATPVGVAKVTKGDIPIYMNALGTVTPLATVTVRAQVSGQLSSVNFTEGQMVKAGDVLAQIDPRTFQAALDQAKGQLARDQALLTNARLDLTRYKTLLAQDSVSQQQYDTQAALVQQDEGIITSDQANVESAAINLGFTRVTAPVAGRVGLRQVDVGNVIQASNTPIVVVTQIQPISALFALPEDNISAITARLKAGATLEADAFDRSHDNQLATGKFASLDNTIDTSTGTVKLRAMFDNADSELFPNQFVNVRLLVDTQHDQTIVPTAAIQRGADGSFVFVVNTDNTVKMTKVTLGAADGERQAVSDGLQADQTVVVDGADRLRDGAHVQIPDENAADGKAGAAPPAGKKGAASTDKQPAAAGDKTQRSGKRSRQN